MLAQAKEQFQDLNIPFTDRTKRAKKRRMAATMNAREKNSRKRHYLDLLEGRVCSLVLIWTAVAPYVFYRVRS